MLLLKASGFSVSVFPDNVFIAIYSIGLFNLCMDSEILNKLSENHFITSVSRYSFGIYLIHPLFLNFLNKGFDIFPDILPIFWGEVVFWIYSFIASYLVCKILFLFKPIKKVL